MKQLPILWQRLVDRQGHTCPRCLGTGEEVERAVEHLRRILAPLDVIPVLERRELDEATFRGQPAESNRIWIAGLPVEEWLGAQAGSSPCCDACGDEDCRTLEVDGQSYEIPPQDMLVRAGLVAASRLLEPARDEVPRQSGSLPPPGQEGGATSCCSGSRCCPSQDRS